MRDFYRKRKITFILLIVTIVISLSSITYAIFTVTTSQGGTNLISTMTCLELSFSNQENAINLVNTYPMSDERGAKNTPYTFTLTNNCGTYVEFSIGLRVNSATTLDNSYVKTLFNTSGYEDSPYLLTNRSILEYEDGTAYLLKTDGLDSNQSENYEFKLWLDEDTPRTVANKMFSGTIILSVSAKTKPAPDGWYTAASGTLLAGIKANYNTSVKTLTVPGTEISTNEEAVMAAAKDDYGTSYYFRGNVQNNYVVFANMCWRIVRVTGDGSIKLVLYNYNSTNCEETGNYLAFARYSADTYKTAFNTSYNSNAYIGFMYGNASSTDYGTTHANENKSTILTNLETWYESKLPSYQNYLADTIWCNDKSTYETQTWVGTTTTYYGAYKRKSTGPNLKCPYDNEGGKLSKFTAEETTFGNGALTYKIGLLTFDEIIYAGLKHGTNNPNANYLTANTGTHWWSMTPYYFNNGYAYVYQPSLNGGLYADKVSFTNLALRPAISLKADTLISNEGNGTAASPFVVN